MSDTPILVTCGLPYTNGPCHLGHLRTYVPADFYVRYLRHCGREVVFVCGSDNHGTPIVISAETEGVTPRQMSERYNAHFDETFKKMGIFFDRFGMTDDPMNHETTTEIVTKLIENGHIYKKTISQSYCPHCEMFLPDRYVEGTCPYCGEKARGDECDQGCGKHLEPGELKDPVCKICGSPAEFRDQEHYFLKLGDFKDFLNGYLPTIQGTSNAKNYASMWVKEGLHDWCVTRSFNWGVKFPGHDDLVVYVWVDAPIGYISFTKEWAKATGGNWEQFWKPEGKGEVIHFIGQDIIYHHCVFWPSLLEGAGYKPPKAVVASGMVKIDDKKFSKSRGCVVWTNEDYLDIGLSPDYLRYYLLSYTSHTKELNFSWKEYQARVNNEFVDTIGNFFYRTLHFAANKMGGIPDLDAEPQVLEAIKSTIAQLDKAVGEYEFKAAVEAVLALGNTANTYIQTNAPWKLMKTDENAARQTIRNCLQFVKALTILLDGIMPVKAQEAWELLGYKGKVAYCRLSEAFTGFDHSELPTPKILFAKIEDEKVAEYENTLKMRLEEAKAKEAGSAAAGSASAQTASTKPKTENKGDKKMEENNEPVEQISIDEFFRTQLKVGKILEVEPVPKSKKLLRIMVDLGEESPRQIVSGIAPYYQPQELVGLSVVVVANLKPAKLCGVESNGMILAAGDEASLLTTKFEVAPGTKVL